MIIPIKRTNLRSEQAFMQYLRPEPTIISIPVALLIAVSGGLLSYWGASARPELVPAPVLAAAVIIICLFLLLLPFATTRRDLWDVLSPEVMGGWGYLLLIGISAVTNHAWPGMAVNPSLFEYLPVAIAAQTTGAVAFFAGAVVARRFGLHRANRETRPERLATVLLLYAAFALYVAVFIPRVGPLEAREMNEAGEISWLLTTGSYIVWQSLPMLIAAQAYLRGARFFLVRWTIIIVFGYATLIFLVSASRTYSTQVIVLLLAAYTIANKRFERRWAGIAIGLVTTVAIVSTAWRISGAIPTISPAAKSYEEVLERLSGIASSVSSVEFETVKQNFHENMVYHLSDNQTMAMLIKNYYRGPLWGEAAYQSLLSGLPRDWRPAGYRGATQQITSHFLFEKEHATDVHYRPDWHIVVGVMGFADFGPAGLIIYPFVTGLAVRWIYNRVVLTDGLGQAGWLLYLAFLRDLWSQKFGSDSTQVLRLLIPLALALYWTTRQESAQSEVNERAGVTG